MASPDALRSHVLRVVFSSCLVMPFLFDAGCGAQTDFSCQDPGAGLPTIAPPRSVCTSGPSTPEFLNRHAVSYRTQLGYDPLRANGLELLAPADLELSSDELSHLQSNGFVISGGRSSLTFANGYAELWQKHLPLYVSADSILEAVHRSYDSLLQLAESSYLASELDILLQDLRRRLSDNKDGFSDAVRHDADVQLAAALSLLRGKLESPVVGGSPDTVASLYQAALAAQGPQPVMLWGLTRSVDFSQFKPRGHYQDSEQLSKYFRAVMLLEWLALPLLYVDSVQAEPTIVRGALEGALLYSRLFVDTALCRYRIIDMLVAAFVGAPQQLTVEQLAAIFAQLQVSTPADLAQRSDDTIRTALLAAPGIVPQTRTFLLFNQRYTLDGQVLNDVSYDRIAGGAVRRTMPSPLDVAFAALGNDSAAQLLSAELAQYPYAKELQCARDVIDNADPATWSSSLYTSWLGALRSLSPPATGTDPTSSGMPAVMATEAWSRRIINTQLASWAELRHDNVLYATPVYGSDVECEFPTAYVDPYPAFYQAISRFAQVGLNAMSAVHRPELQRAVDYFLHLGQVADMLGEMAEYERAGRPFTDAHLAFINELVVLRGECGGPNESGWYASLHFDPLMIDAWKPIIADVYTEPTNQNGEPTGRVLHVATGSPRYMVVTVDGCQGAQAYVGLASSYYEVMTQNYQRLDDGNWRKMLQTSPPQDVPWMQTIIAH